MPSEFRDQKNLPEWIEPHYFRRPREWRVWCARLVWAALALCAWMLPIAIPLGTFGY